MENKIVSFFQSWSNKFLDGFFEFTNFLGIELFFYILFFLLYWLYKKDYAFKFAVIYMFSVIVNYGLKAIIKRPRPFGLQGHGYSFPSGHCQGYAVNATQLYIEAKRHNVKNNQTIKIKALSLFNFHLLADLIVAGVLVAIGRMYFGMHYLTDVIAGLVIGIGVAIGFTYLIDWLTKKIKLPLWKILLCVLPLFVIAYFLVTFTSFLNEEQLYKVYSFIGMGVGVILGYLIDIKFIKYSCNSNLTEKVKRGFLGMFLMVVVYLFTVYKVSNIYYIPLCFLFLGVLGTSLIPFVLQKVFVKTEVVE